MTKLSTFPEADLPLVGDEWLIIIQGGVTKRVQANATTVLGSYTVATLPSPAIAGQWIYVTDDVGGPVPAFADGLNWRRVTDDEIVSYI